MTNEILSKLWTFHRLKISIADFERWVYVTSQLEFELGSERYLELISLNFKSKIDEEQIRNIISEAINSIEYQCSCIKLFQIDIVEMGIDQDNFIGTFERIKERGGKYWWLYMSQCSICKTNWLIAQEERHNDDFHLLRLNQDQVKLIHNKNVWPTEFDDYENLLILSKKAGHSVRFIDPLNSSMIYTVDDLIRNRPNINSEEIANFLNVELEVANKLLKKVKRKNFWNWKKIFK